MWIISSAAVWSNFCLSSTFRDPGSSPIRRGKPSPLLQASRTSNFVLHKKFRRTRAPASAWNCCRYRQPWLREKLWKAQSTGEPGRRKESFIERKLFCSNALGSRTAVKGLAIPGGQEGISTLDCDPAEPRSDSEGSMYHPFVKFALQELSKRGDFSELPIKEEFVNVVSSDGATKTRNWEFTSSKILNVAGFSRVEYDLPIFCADFVSLSNNNIVLLDLNQPRNKGKDNKYKERYFDKLVPMTNEYLKVLPWGGKLTAESLQFFSPLVLWTKVPTENVSKFLYPAFVDYVKAWLDLVEGAVQETDADAISVNRDAQHCYVSWRVNKDPGFPLLTKFYGESLAERFLKEFLFNGDALGTKSFVEHFPEYTNDGSVFNRRSILGKAFESRPWDEKGNFLGLTHESLTTI